MQKAPSIPRQVPVSRADVLAPTQQPSNPTSQDASNVASQQAEKLQAKSYRFPISHARRFAAWTAERGLTEQEATRLAQIMFMEQYNGEH